MYDKKSYKAIKPTLDIDGKTIKIESEPKPKWIIEGDFTNEQLKEAYKLLDSGIKIRKVALRFDIHRDKIRARI